MRYTLDKDNSSPMRYTLDMENQNLIENNTQALDEIKDMKRCCKESSVDDIKKNKVSKEDLHDDLLADVKHNGICVEDIAS